MASLLFAWGGVFAFLVSDSPLTVSTLDVPDFSNKVNDTFW
jgi:hypothetical protein